MSKAAQFLRAIVPDDNLLCVAHVRTYPAKGRPRKPWTQKFFTPEQAANGVLSEHIDTLNEHKDTDVYMGVASYRARERSKGNVSKLQCLLLDIDLKGDRPHYTSKTDAINGLLNLYKQVRCLPKPWIVDSGHGIHAYFAFTKPVTLDQWTVMSNTFAKVAEHVDPRLLADPKPTKDAARVMRLPFTWNAKTEKREFCFVMGAGDAADPDDLQTGLASEAQSRNVWVTSTLPDNTPLVKGSPPPTHALGTAESLGGGFIQELRFENLNPSHIAKGCAQMRRLMGKRGDIPEPEWVLMLRVLNTCQKADELAQTFSKGHPSYSHRETAYKLSHIRKNFGSATASCDEFRAECGAKHCRGCEYRNSVWTPSQISERMKQATAHKDEAVKTMKQVAKGTAKPKGFLPQPSYYNQVFVNETKERVTTLPVFKGKDAGTENEPLVYGHINLIGSSAEIETDSKGEDHRQTVMIHLNVKVWNESFDIAVPYSNLTSHTIDRATEALRKVGVAFKSTNAKESAAIREYLTWLARAGANRPRPYYATKGWARGALTLGARRYLPDGSVVEGVTYQEHVRGKEKTIEKFCSGRAKGSISKWKQAMGVYDGDYPYAHIILLSGLANVLFPLMSDMRGGILLALTGESGGGKTTMMKFMNSFIGDPDEGIIQGDSTPNSLLDMLKQSSVFMLPVDDMIALGRENVSALLTTVTSGKPRLRLIQDSSGGWNPSESMTLNSSLLLTSNYSTTAAFMGGRKKGDHLQLEAAQTRQLEIPADYMNVAGVSLARWEQAARILIEHNGHALEAFAKHIVRHRSVVAQRLAEHRDMFNKLLAARLDGKVVGQYRFWVRYLAAVTTTAEICQQLNLLNWNVKNIIVAGVTLATQQDELTAQTQSTDMDELWNLLTDDQQGRVNINLSEYRVDTDGKPWPMWDDPLGRASRGQLREWAEATNNNLFSQITNRVVNGPQWRVISTEVYENGKLKHIERAVEIQLVRLRSLVGWSDTLSAETWEELYRSLCRAGAVITGVNPARPSSLSKPEHRCYIKAVKNAAGNPVKAVEIIFPPITM